MSTFNSRYTIWPVPNTVQCSCGMVGMTWVRNTRCAIHGDEFKRFDSDDPTDVARWLQEPDDEL